MLAERKVLGWMQLRPGPNRVGPWGLLQPAADAAKLILKEDLTPETADPLIYRLAPFISLLTAFSVYAVIPFGASPSGRRGRSATSTPASCSSWRSRRSASTASRFGGWASGSKYPLLGSVRSTAQMISYELAMSLSFIGVLILAGTTSLDGIVNAQARMWFVRAAVRRLRHLHHHRRGRDQPHAVRSGRGRDRARRRLPHRVLGPALRAVLHRRVRQHAHRVVHRDAAVLRRLERAVRPDVRPGRRVVRAQGRAASCSFTSGCARRCRACATTA